MDSFDENSVGSSQGLSWNDLTDVIQGDYDNLSQDDDDDDNIFMNGSAKLSPSNVNPVDVSTASSITANLMMKAQEHIFKKAISDKEAMNETLVTKNIETEIPTSFQNNGISIPLPIPVIPSLSLDNGIEEEVDQGGVVTTSSSSDDDDDDEQEEVEANGMEIDQGTSTTTVTTVAPKIHSEFLYSSSDDDSSSEAEEPENKEAGNVQKEGAAATDTIDDKAEVVIEENDDSYSEEDPSSSDDDDDPDENDEFENLSDAAYDKKFLEGPKNMGDLRKEVRNLETGPRNDNCKLMASPRNKVRSAKKRAKKEMIKHAAEIRLMNRNGNIKDEDLDDTVTVTSEGKNKVSTYTGLDDETNIGDVPCRGIDEEYQLTPQFGEEPMTNEKALEQKKNQVMQKFAKELDKSIEVALRLCDKDKSRAVFTAFREVCLELRQELPLDYEFPLKSPATEKSKKFLYASTAEFMFFRTWLCDMLYEQLKKMPVQKATSRTVARPDKDLLTCFEELKRTNSGDFIETERILMARAITLRLINSRPLPGTDGEYNTIVVRIPFFKFWDQIGDAVEIKIRKIKILNDFDLEFCRCVMTGKELTYGQPCFSLTYICRVKNKDDDDDDSEKYETRAMFFDRSSKDSAGNFPRMDTIAYASFALLHIGEYAKQRWIEWWIQKYAYVPKTQGIEKCMQEFISGKDGLMAIKKWYYEYKLMGTVLDRFVAL